MSTRPVCATGAISTGWRSFDEGRTEEHQHRERRGARQIIPFTDGIQEGDDGDDGGRTEQGGNSLLVDSGHSSDGGEGEFIGGVWQPNSRDDSGEGHAQAPWVL